MWPSGLGHFGLIHTYMHVSVSRTYPTVSLVTLYYIESDQHNKSWDLDVLAFIRCVYVHIFTPVPAVRYFVCPSAP